MRCFVEKGNFLRTYEDVVDQGFISINEERDYQIKFTVTDSYGNQSVFPFTIKGEKAEIPQNNTCTINMPFNTINMFETENIKVIIPKNTLYRDICFDYLLTPSDNYYSDYHQIHSEYVPLHSWCDVSIKVTKQPKDSSKLYAAKLTGGSCAYTGKYENKIFSFQTRDFGKYIIKADTIAPKITPLNISNFAASPYLSFSISDGQTGIDTYNAYIDDKWVLFEYDSKTNQIRYYLNSKEIGRSKQHQFKLVVKDAVGNESTYKRSFYW